VPLPSLAAITPRAQAQQPSCGRTPDVARNGACPAQAAVRSRHDGWPPMTWQPRHHARSLSLALRQQIVEAELAQHAERGCEMAVGPATLSLRSARGSCGAYSSRKGSS
jgi:hypothetical protein